MLLIIHNLPSNYRYSDVKSLILSKCGLTELILDNLFSEGQGKKVTVGIAEEGDAAILVRKMNGLLVNGHQIYVEDVRKKRQADQPYRSNTHVQEPSNYNSFTMDENTYGMHMPNMYHMPMMQQTPLDMQYVNNPAQQLQTMVPQGRFQGGPFLQSNNQNNSTPLWNNPQPGFFGNRRSRSPEPRRFKGKNASRKRQNAQDYNARRGPSPQRNYATHDFQNRNSSRNEEEYDPVEPTDDDHIYNERRDTFQQSKSSNRLYNRDCSQFNRTSTDVEPRMDSYRSDRPVWNDTRKTEHQDRQFPIGGQKFVGSQKNVQKSQPLNNKRAKFGLEQEREMKPWQRENASHRPHNPVQNNAYVGGKRDLPKGGGSFQPPAKKFAPQPRNSDKPSTLPQTVDAKNNTIPNLVNKNYTWRGQAAGNIAKFVLHNRNLPDSLTYKSMFYNLKKVIRTRLDVIYRDKLFTVPCHSAFIKKYRQRFPVKTDHDLIIEAIRSLEEDRANLKAKRDAAKDAAEAVEKGDKKLKQDSEAGPSAVPQFKQVHPKDDFKIKRPKTSNVKQNAAPQPGQTQPNPGSLPKFPNGDKKQLLELKQLLKREMQEDLYTLPPELQKSVDEHVDTLCDLFMSACMDSEDEREKSICEKITDEVADEFRKIVRLHMTKRLLNVKTGLQVRLQCHRLPRKQVIEDFLKGHGITSLRKSDKGKMFLASCESYEKFDALCALKDIVVDGNKVTIKPLHICGPPAKVSKAKILADKKKYIMSQVDRNCENILIKKEIATETKEVDNETKKDEESVKSDNIDTAKNTQNTDVSNENQNVTDAQAKMANNHDDNSENTEKDAKIEKCDEKFLKDVETAADNEGIDSTNADKDVEKVGIDSANTDKDLKDDGMDSANTDKDVENVSDAQAEANNYDDKSEDTAKDPKIEECNEKFTKDIETAVDNNPKDFTNTDKDVENENDQYNEMAGNVAPILNIEHMESEDVNRDISDEEFNEFADNIDTTANSEDRENTNNDIKDKTNECASDDDQIYAYDKQSDFNDDDDDDMPDVDSVMDDDLEDY